MGCSPHISIGISASYSSKEHLIFGNLYLLIKTFYRKTNKNPPYAFVIFQLFPPLPPALPMSTTVEICAILKLC